MTKQGDKTEDEKMEKDKRRPTQKDRGKQNQGGHGKKRMQKEMRTDNKT